MEHVTILHATFMWSNAPDFCMPRFLKKKYMQFQCTIGKNLLNCIQRTCNVANNDMLIGQDAY